MSSSSQSKNDLAQDRTDWAEDRTVLANERTFAGWMRTGMASLAIAIGLQAVFGVTEPTWIAKSVASIFVILSIVVFWAAWRNACKVISRLDSHAAEPVSKSHFKTIAAIMTLGSLATGVVLWLV
jgi:putative membrane protein